MTLKNEFNGKSEKWTILKHNRGATYFIAIFISPYHYHFILSLTHSLVTGPVLIIFNLILNWWNGQVNFGSFKKQQDAYILYTQLDAYRTHFEYNEDRDWNILLLLKYE